MFDESKRFLNVNYFEGAVICRIYTKEFGHFYKYRILYIFLFHFFTTDLFRRSHVNNRVQKLRQLERC
jgi:hypothetical protein